MLWRTQNERSRDYEVGHLTQRNRPLVAANTCFQRILKNARLLPVAIYVKEPNWIAKVSSPAPAPVHS